MKFSRFVLLGLLGGAVLSWGAGFVFAGRVSLGGMHGPERVPPSVPREESVLFVGDVMLGRYVERFMDEYGARYPYTHAEDLLASSTYVVGNFEATVPRVHMPTPSGGFRFSVREDLLDSLSLHHFTHVFLANNHAWDHGEEGYAYAQDALSRRGLSVGGHPNRITHDDVEVIELSSSRIAVIPIHAVFREPDMHAVQSVLASLSTTTDMQIIYIHWGNEYEATHSTTQERLAHAFIDAGADAVIGHHPHVVQDIDSYKGAPIFYSLGNFIFDQYWNTAVREELAVRLVEGEVGGMRFELIPLWSERANPAPLEGAAKDAYLLSLGRRSGGEVGEYVALGSIPVMSHALAKQ